MSDPSVKQNRIQEDYVGLRTKSKGEQTIEGRRGDHTGSIASSNEFDTALYKERAPSDGIYADTASATSVSMVSGDND